jgi:hypoxanthine phosphoribosyltransferase
MERRIEDFMPQHRASRATPAPIHSSEAEPPEDPVPASHPPNPASPPDPALTVGATTFAHRAEAEFARLLAFYGIPWEYEPRSFAIEWAADGRVTQMFSPDFYLPEYDLYIELTVMKQSLVRRKNRKLRRLRELYPDIQIKLLYRRDFHRLVAGLGLPAEVLATPGGGAAADGAAGRAA